MIGVLEGFAIIGVVIGAGALIGRSGFLGPAAQPVLARTAFFVAAPCLLFNVISHASPATLLAPAVILATVVALLAAGISVLVGRFVLHRDLGQLTVGALAAGYVNSNNIGLPVALYVLEEALLALNQSVMQVAIAVGAAAGGVVVATTSLAPLPWVGAAVVLLSLVLLLLRGGTLQRSAPV